jgi:hypothetical protein
MFEHKNNPLLSKPEFVRRMIYHVLLSSGLIFLSLFLGMLGYHAFENYSWTDSFLNAAMLMGGMGAVNEIRTEAGKIFAGIYAMYCGLVFIFAVGMAAAPLFHRFLHKFHLQMDDKK